MNPSPAPSALQAAVTRWRPLPSTAGMGSKIKPIHLDVMAGRYA